MILFAEDALLGSPMQQGFAADPISYMDRDGRFEKPTCIIASSFFSVWSGRAKLLWRGADGKSSKFKGSVFLLRKG